MSRAIDADKLKKELAPYEENDFSQQIDVILKIVDMQPTLTPPNEPMTCEGCACEECSRDTYPCNCCSRNEETISDQYRPPEGEADA